jgi:hypothetical protein
MKARYKQKQRESKEKIYRQKFEEKKNKKKTLYCSVKTLRRVDHY